MKKVIFFILSTAGMFFASTAQVSLQPTIPAVGLIQKSQLWNLLIVNNSGINYDCRVSLVLRDRLSGRELLTATSGIFTLSNGAKQLNANSLSPIQYNYLQTGIDNNIQGLLPVGSYTVCYLLSALGQKEVTLAEECLPFDTEPLSPPMLITPADSSVLEVAPSQFSWIPPTPVTMFNGLHYEVVIAEIKEGQKAPNAIQENLPFYTEGNQLSTVLNYPTSTIAFEKERWYAWQVVAKDKNNYAGKSEVWVFKVNENVTNLENENETFMELNNSLSNRKLYSFSGSQLKINYYSFDKEHIDTFRIFSSNNQLMQQTTQAIVYGSNFFILNIAFGINTNEIYTLEIEGILKRKLRQNFQIQN